RATAKPASPTAKIAAAEGSGTPTGVSLKETLYPSALQQVMLPVSLTWIKRLEPASTPLTGVVPPGAPSTSPNVSPVKPKVLGGDVASRLKVTVKLSPGVRPVKVK